MAKNFLVFLILNVILLLSPNIYGPNLGLYRKFFAKLQEFLKQKYKRFIKEGLRGQTTTLQPYMIDTSLNLIK